MRISDWSSDVCSSDLVDQPSQRRPVYQCQDRRERCGRARGNSVPFDRLMVSIPERQIDAIIERHAALQARMATGDMAPADFVAASKEFAELEPVAAAARAVVRLRGERTERKSAV